MPGPGLKSVLSDKEKMGVQLPHALSNKPAWLEQQTRRSQKALLRKGREGATPSVGIVSLQSCLQWQSITGGVLDEGLYTVAGRALCACHRVETADEQVSGTCAARRGGANPLGDMSSRGGTSRRTSPRSWRLHGYVSANLTDCSKLW